MVGVVGMTFTLDDLAEVMGFPLSAEQAAAVTAEISQPLLVVAGAGSGKTSVMAARVVWAVANELVEPDRVLGLTFTSKAAGELGHRIRALLEKQTGGLVDELFPTVSTYHSFAHRLVSEQGLRIGIEPGARLLSDYETSALAYDVVVNTRLPLAGLDLTPQKLVQHVVALDAELAEHVVSTDQLRAFDRRMISRCEGLEKTVVADRELLATSRKRLQLCDVVDELRTARLSQRAVDFSDLLRFGCELARRDDVQAELRERYELVLLDEYQDTSIVQTRLLSTLFGGGHAVTAVGDPLQAIYGWRGASAGSMEEFPQLFAKANGAPAQCADLSISQRCPATVLDVANEIGAPLRAQASNVVTLSPSPRSDFNPAAVQAAVFETYAEEVLWLADAVASQVEAGAEPSSIAILCRATSDFPAVMQALVDRGIAVALSGAEQVLSTPEVLDVVSMLRILADPADNAAALRLLLGPKLRLGPRDLVELGRIAATLTAPSGSATAARVVDLTDIVRGGDVVELSSLLEAVITSVRKPSLAPSLGETAIQRLGWLAELYSRLQDDLDLPLAELVARVVSSLGLDVEVKLAQLLQGGSVSRGVAGLDSFYSLVDSYVSNAGSATLPGFLTWLDLVENFKGPTLEFPPAPGCVNLLTVHKAKGLEWEFVAVPFLTSSVFPSAKSRPKWTTSICTLPHSLRGDREFLPELHGFGTVAHREFGDGLRAHAADEERRLAYVAVTRPTAQLLLSGHWWGPSQKTMRGPSVFLTELAEAELVGPASPQWSPELLTWVEESEYDANPALDDEKALPSWPPVLSGSQLTQVLRAAALAENLALSDGECLTEAEAEVVSRWDADIEAVLAGTERPRAGEPPNLSVTSLDAYLGDPSGYVDRIARPMPRPSTQAMSRGTRFHQWVTQFWGQQQMLVDLAEFDEFLDVSDAELERLKDGFARTEFAGRTPVSIEEPFSLSLSGQVVNGRIDAVFETNGRYQVIDWKTGHAVEHDPLQLAVYVYAWSQMSGVDVSLVDAGFVNVRYGTTEWLEDLPSVDVLIERLAAAKGVHRLSSSSA